jgi:hypothetical protein
MTSRQIRADLVTGALLFVLAVAVIYGAWTMDRLELRQIHPLSAPGVLPGLLGLALAVLSAMLIVTSVRRLHSPASASEAPQASDTEPGTDSGGPIRLAGTGALCLIYALGLVGRLPFWLATAIFVTSFIAVFEWDRGDPSRRPIRLAWALFLGLATGWAVSFVFSDIFLVRLP